jgi:hypothetical protein
MFRHANMSQIRKLALLQAQAIRHVFCGMLLLARGYQYLEVNFHQGIQLMFKGNCLLFQDCVFSVVRTIADFPPHN